MNKTQQFITLVFNHRDNIINRDLRVPTNKESTEYIKAYRDSVKEVAESSLSSELQPLLKNVKTHYDQMMKEAHHNNSEGYLRGAFSLDATHVLNPALDALLDEMPRLKVSQKEVANSNSSGVDNNKRGNTEQRMFDLVRMHLAEGKLEIISWSKRQFADELDVSPTGISKTKTWKLIVKMRKLEQSASMTPVKMLQVVDTLSEFGHYKKG